MQPYVENSDREVFISYISSRDWPTNGLVRRTFESHMFAIRYRKYVWYIDKSHKECTKLNDQIGHIAPDKKDRSLEKNIFEKYGFCQRYLSGEAMTEFLQKIVDDKQLFSYRFVLTFFEISDISFSPRMGRRGKEGHLRKKSGGYMNNRASTTNITGNVVPTFKQYWFAMFENGMTYYDSDLALMGCIQVDHSFIAEFSTREAGNVFLLRTRTRVVTLQAATRRDAILWVEAINGFYAQMPRRQHQPYGSSFPVRELVPLQLYTCGKPYFSALAEGLLAAREEIFITAWKLSPSLLLSRHPLPSIRLDQILKHKADHGVKIYVLLYKEVELSGTGNESYHCRIKLCSLSDTGNIHVLRHPNKIFGGSTAVLWSHHEKLVIVDRRLGFVGGIDPAFGRWDDISHPMTDESCTLFPGEDYYQPAMSLIKPARVPAGVLSSAMGGPLVSQQGAALWKASRAVVNSFASQETEEDIKDDGIVDSIGLSSVDVAVTGNATDRKDATLNMHGPAKASREEEEENAGGLDLSAETTLLTERSLDVPAGSNGRVLAHRTEREILSGSEDIHEDLEVKWQGDFTQLPDGSYFDVSSALNESTVPPAPRTQVLIDSRRLSTKCESGSVLSPAGTTLQIVHSYVPRYLSVSFDVLLRSIVSKLLGNVYSGFQLLKELATFTMENPYQAPEMYPRMPWHDVHGCVTGRVVKDLAFHFVQRWNHHRLAKGITRVPILTDAADNDFHGVCARCEKTELNPALTHCPVCGLFVGASVCDSSLFTTRNAAKGDGDGFVSGGSDGDGDGGAANDSACDSNVSEGLSEGISSGKCPHIVYKCAFDDFLFTINGIGPVVILCNTGLLPEGGVPKAAGSARPDVIMKGLQSCELISSSGPSEQCDVLIQKGLLPLLGDVVVSIEGVELLYLEENEVTRVLGRYLDKINDETDSFTEASVTFRRHFLPKDITDLIDEDNEVTRHALWLSERDTWHMWSVALSNLVSNKADPKEVLLELCYQYENEVAVQKFQDYLTTSPERGSIPDTTGNVGTHQVQVLRSVGEWSVGYNKPECSILNAWVETIANAEHFVYIENQFFISNVGDPADGIIKNGIAAAILNRIFRAIDQHQVFRVIVMLPIHPEGDYVNTSGPRSVMNFQYRTICRGKSSMLSQIQEKLSRRGMNSQMVSDYIDFYSLRTWGTLNQKFVCDQIYIHDKLLIVDDRVIVMGSANVNDRSMLGTRDTEVGVRIEDTNHVVSSMNGQPYVVGRTPHEFRKQLMALHLGSSGDIDMTDPIHPRFYYGVWSAIAMSNTLIYDKLDGPVSYEKVKKISELKSALINTPMAELSASHKGSATMRKDVDIGTQVQMPHTTSVAAADVETLVEQLQGFLVKFPLHFLEHEDLSVSIMTSTIVGNEVFT